MSIGICKINNLGNTCYMNSIFQILLHTPELTHILNTSKPHNISETRDEYDIIYYWKDMIKTVYSSNNILTITPRSLVQCIRKLSAKRLSVKFDNTQQDATEFLLFLMDVFHIALAHNVNIQISTQPVLTLANIECYKRIKTLYSNSYSDIIKSFYGMTITEILDKQTLNVVSYTFDPYFMLTVPFITSIHNPTIYDCLDMVLNMEVLEPNSWINTETQKYQDVIKNTKLWSVPSVFIIHVKKYPTSYKVSMNIDIPHMLTLRKYLHISIPSEYNYKLYAVCNHQGTIHGGHYYSYVYIDQIDSWVVFNDSHMPYKIKIHEVITPHAVCMFYRRI